MLTHESLLAILANIEILDRKFKVTPAVIVSSGNTAYVWLLQVTYVEPDIDTREPATQESREWLIRPTMSEGEIVRTAYAAVTRSYMHIVSEHFTYKGKRVYGPHIDIDALLNACEQVH